MNRKTFFAALFGVAGVAKAQQWKQCVLVNEADPNETLRVCTDKNKPALNNECPVCGTMAEPLRKYKSGLLKNCKPAGEYLVSCEDDWITPEPQIARCKRCNAAFWQDAR